MARNILLITTDQQRFDALGCNGGQIARTPNIDRLAGSGLNYLQARNQSTVCMPARSTILTGQSIRRHGVTSNGIPLPPDEPSLAHHLKANGYETALFGKAHFEPHAAKTYFENTAAGEGSTGPHRGFDRMELCGHTGRAGRSLFHYPKWLAEAHPDHVDGFHEYAVKGSPSNAGWGETGAPQVARNPIPVEHYHTHWTAARTIDWLRGLDDGADWFCWMSFPDPHHPWDPPAEAAARFPWREMPLPDGYPGSPEKCLEILDAKPRHWRAWYTGAARFNFEVPPAFVPAELTADQIREVNAMVHAENELIDAAVGMVMDHLAERDWDDGTDVFFTTDHGELQGDFGMLFKGPYHVEALMHVPLIWRPAPAAGVPADRISAEVGHIDIAPTACAVAGLPVPDWMQGRPLPTRAGDRRLDGTTTEWFDTWEGHEIVLQTLVRDGWVVTRYGTTNYYDGTEGELYDLNEDPRQWVNLWDDPARAAIKADLLAALDDQLPEGRETALEKVAPV
ncbi:MAG: sulfatase-like hydrolase/transferase [Magnetovibrio sp.]|nr:sulfatase-like hydrolase/transferase [Magnetovibrio sp.]